MLESATPIDDESVDRSDQGGDRPPQRRPGGAVNFPISLVAAQRERHRSFLAHPSNVGYVKGLRSGWGEQASVPQAGHQAQFGGTDVMPDWLVQEVMNEVKTRTRNEWIEETNDSYGAVAAVDDYACECSDALCTATISMTRVEYEAVRRDGTHFAIAINHENPLVDRVVSETERRFAIVQKCFPPGRRIANESNPRH
jgi:hypothetical protein